MYYLVILKLRMVIHKRMKREIGLEEPSHDIEEGDYQDFFSENEEIWY